MEERLLGEPGPWSYPATMFSQRIAYAAVHVAADPLGENVPGAPAIIDWDATLAFRHYLWSLGFGIAEAMDTAQRGMGLDWAACQELIRRSTAEALSVSGDIAAGVGTDHTQGAESLGAVTTAYLEQLEVVEASGAKPILMASRDLASVARSADDYRRVYDELLSQVSEPVILHWLGADFDPALRSYWTGDEKGNAADVVVDLITDNVNRVDGIKVSLLDARQEVSLRSRLPEGVRVYTGDDFNYPELIRGDGHRHSDALLGILAAIAPAASAALQALDRGDLETYDAILDPTVALSRHIFTTPTYYYKVGITFLAWLSGHQESFAMIGGLQSARSFVHLAEIVRLADNARVLTNPDLAAMRWKALASVSGLDW